MAAPSDVLRESLTSLLSSPWTQRIRYDLDQRDANENIRRLGEGTLPVLVQKDFAEKLRRVQTRAKAEGIEIRWRFGYRPIAYQRELLECWKDPECRKRRGIVARPATPGLSTHNWASGVDFDTVPEKKHARVGAIAKEEGLRWGGDFVKNHDSVHLDDRQEFTLEQLRARFRVEDLVAI